METAELIRDLAIAHRAKQAWRQLLAMGEAALPIVRQALTDPSADVRLHCVRFLDHYPTAELARDLAPLAQDDDPRVRVEALHALACDRCKPDRCAPDAALTVPIAIAIVRNDPDYHVRNMALEVLGKAAHTSPEAIAAIEAAKRADPSPAVRKKAAWYAPGGPIFKRTSPVQSRKASAS